MSGHGQRGLDPVGSYLSLVEGLKETAVVRLWMPTRGGSKLSMRTWWVTRKGRATGRGSEVCSASGKELGWQPIPGEGVEQPGVRATRARHAGPSGPRPEVLETARTLAHRYLADPSPLIHPGRCRRQPRGAGR